MSRSSRILETLHSPVACYQRPHGQQIADTQDFGAANVRGAASNESLRTGWSLWASSYLNLRNLKHETLQLDNLATVPKKFRNTPHKP